MRNLVVCCDGTWNTPDDKHDGVPVPTNVVRLHNALAPNAPDGTEQIKYYHPGVGTDGSWWDKIAGGGLGIGLDKNVQSAYRWLCAKYQTEDRIFLFGFSRGAFTVRSLGGMIGRCGLLNLDGLQDKDVWDRVAAAYDSGYREKKKREAWAAGWKFHDGDAGDNNIPIFFIGVWDTVGALGIPDDMALLDLLDDNTKYSFHDTDLGAGVVHARHAIALDEMRASFAPTLWTNVAGRKNVKQVWFPGVHSDVGGGYPETGLSDSALDWMMNEAKAEGLAFRDNLERQIRPDSLAVLHDSLTGVFQHLPTQPRAAPFMGEDADDENLHVSLRERRANPPITQGPYRPTITLKIGESRKFTIYARDPWNETGLYLEKGARYEFKAEGEWLDGNIRCGPEGTEDGSFDPREVIHMAGTLWGKIETVFKNVTDRQAVDFKGSKRVEAYPWFALTGAIANAASNQAGAHEFFEIGKGCAFPKTKTKKVANPGYFYAFANDAWHFYDNNRGSVTLTVTRKP